MTMKVLKRALSLFIVGLFVFTAFAVIQSGGTNTASIHSVSSPTSVLPYTTTSNGLTYTVESNGTYLWNGHYLRDPPVAYPKVPTIAPDGLPYGAVGSVGAQGHIGPYSFTKGTPQIKGVSPNGTAGVATVIGEATSWDNTTVYLGGNVTWTGNYQLFINNTIVVFNESYGSQAWQYGFNMTNHGGEDGQFLLNILDNSMITQKNSTSRPFYISTSWPTVDYSFSTSYYFGATVQNSTIYSNGTETTGLSDGWYSSTVSSGVQKENGPIGLEINYFNYSAYYGNTPLNEVPDNGIGWGNFTASNNAWVGTFVSHSYISDGFVSGRFENTTFVDSMIYPVRTPNIVSIFLGQQLEYSYLNYNTIIGLSTWRWFSFTNSISGDPYEIFINHTLVENSNITNSSFLAVFENSVFSMQNTTFLNISFIQNGISAVGNFDPETLSGGIYQHTTSSETIIGSYDPSQSNVGNFSMVHSSFINITSDYGPLAIVAYQNHGVNQSAYMRYDIFVNLTNEVTSYNAGDVSVYALSGTIDNATGIIMKNIKDVFPTPRNNVHTVMATDPFVAIYAFGDGLAGYAWSTIHYAPTGGVRGYASNNNSWYVNISRTEGGLMANGVGPVMQSNDTFININNTVAMGMAAGSGLGGFVAENDAVYGLYNYSVGVGGYNTGSDNGSRLIGIHVYDVSASSISYIATQDNISFSNINGSLIGINANGTITQGQPTYPPTQFSLSNPFASASLWREHSTKIDIVNSTISQLILGELQEGYVYPVYTPLLLQNEFNITIKNTYMPSSFTARTNSNLTSIHNVTENLFSYSSGSTWLNTTPFSNPSFLTLEGYLGIFSGQTYTLNASNIKNEASLPIYYSGNEIADIPASSAHYNFTAISQSEYSVSTTSAASPSVNLYFHGIPGLKYVVSIISNGGLFKSFVENATSAGIVNATYNPATMPLDPTFEVSPYVAPLPPYNPVQPNPPMNFFPAYVFYILLAASAAGVAAGIYILLRRR